MENGELIVTIMYCSILPMMSRWIKRTLSALSYLSRGYDMVQVYNKMSDYNDKELWSANKPSWDTVYKHLRYISMLITENAAGGIKED
jgi:hypothetical protein